MAKKFPLWLAAFLPLAFLSACKEEATQTSTTADIVPVEMVTGEVYYLERIALHPNSIVKVELQDVSLMDAPAKTISVQEFETANLGPPWAFELSYDPEKIDPKHRYSISARITLEDQLLFISDTHHGVITQPTDDPLKIRLVKVQHTKPAAIDPEGD